MSRRLVLRLIIRRDWFHITKVQSYRSKLLTSSGMIRRPGDKAVQIVINLRPRRLTNPPVESVLAAATARDVEGMSSISIRPVRRLYQIQANSRKARAYICVAHSVSPPLASLIPFYLLDDFPERKVWRRGVGFEPTVEFPLHTLSKRAP